MTFKVRCEGVDIEHAKFSVFDPHGANCGTVTVRTEDMLSFVKHNWAGTVDWNGKLAELAGVVT